MTSLFFFISSAIFSRLKTLPGIARVLTDRISKVISFFVIFHKVFLVFHWVGSFFIGCPCIVFVVEYPLT